MAENKQTKNSANAKNSQNENKSSNRAKNSGSKAANSRAKNCD